ncbi:hypothetical protein [Streptomyces sp. NPDC002825]|uniref:hypothetical protein n=1 Tax=Streptomyces sp. NPDC002825 TaxID=3154666 RepID=UPI00333086FD
MSPFFDASPPRQVLPGEYPLWDEALALVNRDLSATLPDQKPLRLLGIPGHDGDEAENVYVTLANGEWHGTSLDPESADDPGHALAAVADAAQETVTELLWQAWPLCGEHDLGMHLREADGQPSWWCAGGRVPREPAHVRAAVGGLDALVRPHRPNRKQRRRTGRRDG